MTAIQLKGYITEKGDLQLERPLDLPPGEVRVTIETQAAVEAEDIPWEEQPWKPEEIAAFLRFEPQSGKAIAESEVIGVWADQGITDPVAWVEEVRRKERATWGW